MSKTIYFTVTNDVSYDQRMQRICGSLSKAGYNVVLVGRRLSTSKKLSPTTYTQKRLSCFFTKGKFFYLEYNIRLFFFLLLKKMDAICAIDLDTILPCYFISTIKKCTRIYDAHELFTEMKEIKSRKNVYTIWNRIEKFALPKFTHGYTVCDSIANEFEKKYAVRYSTIRNMPQAKPLPQQVSVQKKFIYSGAVNEGRGFEVLIPAMQFVNYPLQICGNGNFMQQAKALVQQYNLQHKISFSGMLLPQQLDAEVQKSYIGINLIENFGLNQYYSLANKFFDYIQSALPQITMNFPEYKKINDAYNIGVLINHLNVNELAAAMNNLMEDVVLYQALKNNCLKARQQLVWQNEEKILLNFYHQLLHH